MFSSYERFGRSLGISRGGIVFGSADLHLLPNVAPVVAERSIWGGVYDPLHSAAHFRKHPCTPVWADAVNSMISGGFGVFWFGATIAVNGYGIAIRRSPGGWGEVIWGNALDCMVANAGRAIFGDVHGHT